MSITTHKVKLGNRKLTVGFEEYQDGSKRTAIVLYTSKGEEWTVATVNIPSFELKEGQVIIKSYEDSNLLPALVSAGIVKVTGIKVPSGFIEADLCELLIKPSPTEQDIKSFIKTFGQDDDELETAMIEMGEEVSDSDFSELAIALGYVWLEKYRVWVKKDNSNYTDSDELIYQHLYEEKFK